MNRNQQSVPVVIPPALDADDSELAARNEFLAQKELTGADNSEEFANADEAADEIILDETDAAPGSASDEREAKNLRREKRRKSLMFLGVFGAGFSIFVVFLAWAFGFGFFAPAKRVSVDRNQKTNGANSTSSTTSGDEKLKTALALVANETGNNKEAPVVSDALNDPNAQFEQDLKLSSGDKTAEQPNNQTSGNMIVLPDENSGVKSNRAQNQIRGAQPLSQGAINTQPNFPTNEISGANSFLQPKAMNKDGALSSDKSDGSTPARSVFFGKIFDKNDSVRQNSTNNTSNYSARRPLASNESANVPAFGTLLPVRFLGAIYTLRGTGGLVRMELSRSVRKGAFSYPAGTVIVGRLRGSEYNRAFVSAIGAIDPKSGKLVKFEGEILGVDGASGAKGERKSLKSWGSRFLSGLREAGGQAVNVLAARGGGRGGTIVLGGSGGLGGEVSSVIRGDSQENSFVIVRAGTEAYVLITDLPAEQRGDDSSGDQLGNLAGSANGQLPGINLTEPEMAEILSTDDPNKIRAALLKMSPQFRALAIKAMEDGK
jgi:hypothetical protein